MIVDMRLRPPLPTWVSKPQFNEGCSLLPDPRGLSSSAIGGCALDGNAAGRNGRGRHHLGRHHGPPGGRTVREHYRTTRSRRHCASIRRASSASSASTPARRPTTCCARSTAALRCRASRVCRSSRRRRSCRCAQTTSDCIPCTRSAGGCASRCRSGRAGACCPARVPTTTSTHRCTCFIRLAISPTSGSSCRTAVGRGCGSCWASHSTFPTCTSRPTSISTRRACRARTST